MKKKIKDLTLKDYVEHCKKHKCSDCPNKNYCIFEKFLLRIEGEVEIDE